MAVIPTDLSGLTLWLNADSIVSGDGSAVSTWADSSGGSRDFTQGTGANQPVTKTSIVNGHRVVRFDSSDFLGRSITLSDLFSATDATIFFVGSHPGSSDGVLFIADPGGGFRVLVYAGAGNTVVLLDYGDENGTPTGGRYVANFPAGWDTGFHVTALRRGSTTSEGWIDGLSLGAQTMATSLVTANTCTAYVGADNGGTGWNSDIAEIIIFNRALNDHETRQMLEYLGTKYALTLSGAITGAISGTGTLAGAITGKGNISSAVAGVGTLAGSLAGSKAQVSAAVAGVGTLAATAGGIGGLSVAIAGVGNFAGAATGTGNLTAAISGVGTFAAALSGANLLTGTIAGVGTLAANVTGTGAISSAIAGTSALAASLEGTGNLTAAIAGVGTFAATASARVSTTANIQGTGTLAAAVTGRGAVTATIAGTSALAAMAHLIAGTSAHITGTGIFAANVIDATPPDLATFTYPCPCGPQECPPDWPADESVTGTSVPTEETVAALTTPAEESVAATTAPDAEFDCIYYSTAQTWTASCDPGNPAAATATVSIPARRYSSPTSQSEADNIAFAVAQDLAEGQLVCLGVNQLLTYELSCPNGQTGTPVTVVIPAGTYSADNQGAANALALAAAQAQAEALITCRFFNTLQSYTATCPGGQSGTPVARTVAANTYTGITLLEANTLALQDAQNQAESALVCGYVNEEQTATATCPSGRVGTPSTSTVPAGTYSGATQAAANATALAAAQVAAAAGLSCLFLNQTQSYTASCPDGYSGVPVTVTKTPNVAYAAATLIAANALALAAATMEANAALSCLIGNELQTYTATCGGGFAGNSVTRSIPALTYYESSLVLANATALAAATALANSLLICDPLAPLVISPGAFPEGVITLHDNSFLIFGTFNDVTISPPGFVTRNGVVRVNTGNTLDTVFNPSLTGTTAGHFVVVQSDGNLIIGGGFHFVGATARRGLVRMSPSGVVDASYYPNSATLASSFSFITGVIQASGKLVTGGAFSDFNGSASHSAFVRLNTDGTVDPSFTTLIAGATGVPNFVYAVISQSDGKLLIGGEFVFINGIFHRAFGRVTVDGGTDPAFNPVVAGFFPRVLTILQQASGKIVFGGDSFSTVNGVARSGGARLNLDGTLDTTFPNPALPSSGPADGIHALTADAQGTLIGGAYTSIFGVARSNLIRLLPNDTIDTSFNPVINGAVDAIHVRPSGLIMIVGSFTVVNGQSRVRFARLNPDGSIA